MSKKKIRRPKPILVGGLPRPVMHGLAEAERLSKRGRHVEARAVLDELDQRYPNRVEILTNLYNENLSLNDLAGVQRAAARLIRLEPDNADLTISLAGAYLANQRPALALRTFRHFCERWPEHERAADARETALKLEPIVSEMLADVGFTGDDAPELGELHEEAQVLLEQGQYAESRAKLQELLQRRPDFISGMNNLSLIALAEGKFEEAIETAERVLERDERNFHALANLTRFLVLRGRLDEARQYAARLKAIDVQEGDVWIKKVEALSYLGDDAGVLEVLREVESAGEKHIPPSAALIYHLAAIAALRSGKESEAKRLWQRALEISPGFELAESNLRDLRQPVGERHAPWPFNINEWVRRSTIEDLIKQTQYVGNSESAMMRAGRRFLDQHPEMNVVIPILLERGDPVGREFALRTAALAQTPELLSALRDFVLSQHGPDALRIQASEPVVKAGLLPGGMTRFWVSGEWQEVLLMGVEIHGEPVGKMSPKTERLLRPALEALHAGNGVKGETLLKQALEIEPNNPALLNNLGKAYELQGRQREAEELAYQIHERFPDYLFGRTNLAMVLILKGELDRADELLKPLFSRQRMHFGEYGAFAAAQVELALARGNRKAARSWFEMWEQVDPDDPNLEHFRRRIGSVGWKQMPRWRR